MIRSLQNFVLAMITVLLIFVASASVFCEEIPRINGVSEEPKGTVVPGRAGDRLMRFLEKKGNNGHAASLLKSLRSAMEKEERENSMESPKGLEELKLLRYWRQDSGSASGSDSGSGSGSDAGNDSNGSNDTGGDLSGPGDYGTGVGDSGAYALSFVNAMLGLVLVAAFVP